jgi:hypothetical protein
VCQWAKEIIGVKLKVKYKGVLWDAELYPEDIFAYIRIKDQFGWYYFIPYSAAESIEIIDA